MKLRKNQNIRLTADDVDDNFAELSQRVDLLSNQTVAGKKTFAKLHINENINSTMYTYREIVIDKKISEKAFISEEYPTNAISVTENTYIVKDKINNQNHRIFKKDPVFGWSKFLEISDAWQNEITTIIKLKNGDYYIAGDFPNSFSYNFVKTNQFTDVSNIIFGFNDNGASSYFIEKTDGTVWSIGNNFSGQLGLGDTTDRTSFTQLPVEFNNPNKISSHYRCTFIEKSDGTVWAVGYNGQGQLGLGDTLDRTSFTQVPGITNPNKIVCGAYYTYIEKSDGTVWVCGDNYYGQLGLGDSNTRTTLTQVPGITNPNKIVCSSTYYTYIEKSDGTVWSCGYNIWGQLGLGDTNTRYSFTQIPLIANPRNIIIENSSVFIEKSDGTVWVTGYNQEFNLGFDGTSNSPVTFTQNTRFLNPFKILPSGIVDHNKNVWFYGYNSRGRFGMGEVLSDSWNSVVMSPKLLL